MRILLSAFAFSPYRGGECAVGWNIANELAKKHNVTVICGDVRGDERTRKELERYYRGQMPKSEVGADKGLRIEYVAPSKLIVLLEKAHTIPGFWGAYYFAYNLWQRAAFRRARFLHAKDPFDVAHQLNMIGYREPGYLWKLPIPFVWGPVGGASNEPMSFCKIFSISGCCKVFIRTVVNEIQKRFSIRARRAAKKARKLWAVTDADYRMISGIWGVKCTQMVETGTLIRAEGHIRDWDGHAPLNIIWSGIHTSRKALPILLYALNGLDRKNFHVDILGGGPETKAWKALSQKLGIESKLDWHGQISHDEALKVMGRGHVFAFPSLKEGTPHVVLEALSLGLPVICHDACGMGSVVTDECGIKIPLKNLRTSIEGFSKAIDILSGSALLLARKSSGALHRARELTWSNKVSQIINGYDEIV